MALVAEVSNCTSELKHERYRKKEGTKAMHIAHGNVVTWKKRSMLLPFDQLCSDNRRKILSPAALRAEYFATIIAYMPAIGTEDTEFMHDV